MIWEFLAQYVLPKEVLKNVMFTKHGNGTSAVLGAGLGIALGFGLGLALFTSYWSLGAYLTFLAFFHLSEYLHVAIYNPQSLSADSFLLNHSPEYSIAIASSIVEYFVESLVFPGIKELGFISVIGILGAFAGQIVRSLALFTARHNFTHDIAEKKRDEHVLVTTGIYSRVRHPGYLGWFWWSVATQVVLMNPICTLGFAYAAWKFFKERIEYEEETLVKHFAEKYEDYKKRVPTLIPGIP